MEKKTEFKCPYCGTTMSLSVHKVNGSKANVSYRCPKCGAQGPRAFVTAGFSGMSDAAIDSCRKWLDLLMVGKRASLNERDVLRDALLSASGEYSEFKSLHLPSAEKSVDVGRDRFREAMSRKKGQSFHEWVKGIRMACIQLDLALSNRERTLSKFAEVRANMRKLQNDLKEKRHERKA